MWYSIGSKKEAGERNLLVHTGPYRPGRSRLRGDLNDRVIDGEESKGQMR